MFFLLSALSVYVQDYFKYVISYAGKDSNGVAHKKGNGEYAKQK